MIARDHLLCDLFAQIYRNHDADEDTPVDLLDPHCLPGSGFVEIPIGRDKLDLLAQE